MRNIRLRRIEGASPPARSKARVASRLAFARYPFGKFGDDLQRAAEVAARNALNKLEHIAASATAKHHIIPALAFIRAILMRSSPPMNHFAMMPTDIRGKKLVETAPRLHR